MPAIRDFASNFTTTTTGTTIIIPVPAYEQNDLLVTMLVSDTGTGLWSCTGWNLLHFQTNTTQLACMYRIATSSEPDDYTFTRTVNETFNGRMISIRDVNTTAPFGETDANTGLITIAINSGAGTFTRSAGGSGSFLTDGFANGQTILTSGFASAGNNTIKVISNVTATVITVSNTTGLVTVADTANTLIATGVAVRATQGASAKYTLPQVTTTVADSLVLYSVANSAAGVPSIIEGPVSLIAGEDGTAESGGDAWTFMPSTGASPNNVTCSNISTGAGMKAALQVAPPSGGATVVPAYCAADSSVYIGPIHGTTAYNGDAALAATYDTLIGTSLNGVTLADAGVAAIADVGINAYHSAGRLTSITGTKNWSAAAIDLATANNVNVSGKNVLVHTGPSTPGQIQRFGAAASQKGTAFTMMSTTGNWKSWHVHGKGTPYGYQRDVPLIVNSDNTTGLLESAGTFDASAVDVFGFAIAGGGVTTTIWDFYSLWVLDTVVICGGNSSSPMEIPGIVRAAADGHERKSVVQQGTAQAIVFQPIQIGNGGTDPVFMDLNATALEFPRQYSLTELQVNYCSVDNVAGITYYAGASDTIKHRNSVISSPSKYHWKFHASTSTSATYDFSGLQVIGAGTITLKAGITFANMSWSGCDNIDSVGATLTNCSIENSTSAQALTVTSTANMALVTSCAFNNNNVAGDTAHAIQLTATGTHTFDNITFSGGGPAQRSFVTSSSGINDGTDVITLDAAHGYANGDPAYYQDQGGSQNVGLTDGGLYFVRSESSTTITLYDTAAHAIAGGATGRVNLTAAGSETHYICSAKADVFNNSGGSVTINITNGGSTPTIRNANGSTTTVNNAVTIQITAKDEQGDPIQNARVAIYKVFDASEVLNTTTNASGIASTSYNFNTDTDIYVRVRKSSTGDTKYFDNQSSGTITSAGYSATVTLIVDTIVI